MLARPVVEHDVPTGTREQRDQQVVNVAAMGTDMNAADLAVHLRHGGRENLRLAALDIYFQEIDAVDRRQHVLQRYRRHELDFPAQAEAELAHDTGRVMQKNICEHALARAVPLEQVDRRLPELR